MVLRQYLRHGIVSDKLPLVELSEDPFSEGILDCFEVYLREPGEDAILPVAVSEESVQMRMRCVHPARGFAKMLPLEEAWLKPRRPSVP